MRKKSKEKIKRIRKPGDPILVNSKAYGKHERSPRFTHTPKAVNSSLRKYADLNTTANKIAKAINDATKPFRLEIKDGTAWSRLVGTLKKDLASNPIPNLKFLKDFHFKANHTFQGYYHTTVSVTDKNNQLVVEISSASADTINKFKATDYEQTLVIIFINNEMTTQTLTHTRVFPVKRKSSVKLRGIPQKFGYGRNADVARFPIPQDTVNILVAVRCRPLSDGVCHMSSGCAFAIMDVLETFVESNEETDKADEDKVA